MPTKKKTAKAKKPARKVAKKPAKKAAAAGPSVKQMFLDSFQREHEKTMKVLNWFPAEQSEFRPHPRSQSARDLAWTFVMEQALITKAITDTLVLGGGGPAKPDDFRVILEQFDRDYHDLVALIKRTADPFKGTVKFPTGPKQIEDWPKAQFCWMMLSDQIHHRGQMTVYSRMAGGKVPAVYGPSADEPWF